MSKYTVELNYKTSIMVTVEAKEEGEALDKARNIAEEADMREFIIQDELESRIISNS